MQKRAIIQTVNKFLDEFGLKFRTSEGPKELPYEATIVEFGMDEKERPVAVQILHYSQDLLASLRVDEKQPNPEHLSILSFIMTVPTKIPDGRSSEVLQLIALANKSLPLGGLNFSAVEKAVYYTYSLPLFDEPPTELTLLAILQTAIFVKETFFSTIDEVANGKTSVEKILAEPARKAVHHHEMASKASKSR